MGKDETIDEKGSEAAEPEDGLRDESPHETDDFTDAEWERRVLCSDEGCIGVIGPDGRCKECGRPYEGDLDAVMRSAGVSDDASDDTQVDDSQADGDDDDAVDTAETDDEAPGDEWKDRILCRDESCIGVIGPDGRCKECGKPYDE